MVWYVEPRLSEPQISVLGVCVFYLMLTVLVVLMLVYNVSAQRV